MIKVLRRENYEFIFKGTINLGIVGRFKNDNETVYMTIFLQ